MKMKRRSGYYSVHADGVQSYTDYQVAAYQLDICFTDEDIIYTLSLVRSGSTINIVSTTSTCGEHCY